jgi:N-carbamoylputrescine amidase
MENIRIACVIFHSPLNQTGLNLERTARWVVRAQSEGVRILCFPEMHLTGYGIRDGIRGLAETIHGPTVQCLIELAEKYRITILAGMAEKDETGRVFASHLVAAPEGLKGVYRKLHIAPPETHLFTGGDGVPVFDIPGLRFGIQLCYDAHFPELSTLMAIRGAEVIFFPHASPRGNSAQKYRSWLRHLIARAYDNSVFVVACNQTGDNGEGLKFPGIALVIEPDGNVLNCSLENKERLFIADLSADALERTRGHRMRNFLSHRRNDLFPVGP